MKCRPNKLLNGSVAVKVCSVDFQLSDTEYASIPRSVARIGTGKFVLLDNVPYYVSINVTCNVVHNFPVISFKLRVQTFITFFPMSNFLLTV